MKRSEAIKRLLVARTHPDLAALYTPDMEVQVIVFQGDGRRADFDGDYRGRGWHSYTNGSYTWYAFRVPKNAMGEPEDNDFELPYPLAEHAEGIGMTGWDWRNRRSRYVAFDFDGVVGHSDKHAKKLTDLQLQTIRNALADVSWVTIRKSTSGSGIHLYVHLDVDVEVNNHTEHAALARAILSQLSGLVGFDFESKVDVCGGNIWVWHRRKGADGLASIKQGTPLRDVPGNWRDHLEALRKRTKTSVSCAFSDLSAKRSKVPLDEEHRRLIRWLQDNRATGWWNSDHGMLITHTSVLAQAHQALGLKGVFRTISTGSEPGDYNAFAFAMPRGAWAVRRYSPGTAEDASWEQVGGWTKCFLNREPDLATAARCHGGVELSTSGYRFESAASAAGAATLLGVDLGVPAWASGRPCRLARHKDQRLIVEFDRDSKDPVATGWAPERGKWRRMFQTRLSPVATDETGTPDEIVRHLVTEQGHDCGWAVKADEWQEEPLLHVKATLEGPLGMKPAEVKNVIGACVLRPWKLVSRPFQSEYPEGRCWNRYAAQLKVNPTESDTLSYSHWLKVLNHCGKGLDDAVSASEWARTNGIESGADYLKLWLASLIQEPVEPLPYLFLYGPQGSGKSILHEAVSLLITGVMRADNSLMSGGNFNGELEGAVLCVVEETDMERDWRAYNRIKDWVTSKELTVHRKSKTPFLIPNTTHWMQMSNSVRSCPVFPGDTRIVVVYVDSLPKDQLVPKKEFLRCLEKEAPDFLAALLATEIPPSGDRLNVPVITTSYKLEAEDQNQTPLEEFLSENCFYVPGAVVPFKLFYERFVEWADPNQLSHWSRNRVARDLPPHYPRGRLSGSNDKHVGNLSFKQSESQGPVLVSRDRRLEPMRKTP